MRSPGRLASLVGEWSGVKRVWLTPDSPVLESEATASVMLAAQGRFATIRYTWAEDGPQDGMLLVRLAEAPSAQDVIWIDSWHMGSTPMVCQGEVDRPGLVSVRGSYQVKSGPDWGWRIELHADSEDSFRMIMYNITPDGQEALGVQADFPRTLR